MSATEKDTMSFDEAMAAIDESQPQQDLWAVVQYEEGTSGPVKVVEGILVDDDGALTLVEPESGLIISIGASFIIRVEFVPIEAEAEAEADVDEDDMDEPKEGWSDYADGFDEDQA